MHRHHRRAVVVHEVPADLVGPVGDPRAQQQHGGVHRPGRRAPPVPADSRRASPSLRYSTAVIRPSAPATSRVTSAPVSSVTFGCASAFAIPTVSPSRLGAGRVGKGVPGRRRPLQPAVEVDPERQRRRRDARRAAAAPAPRRCPARPAPAETDSVRSAAARSGPARRRHGRRRAPRPPDTRARARRRRSASRASCRRGAGSAGSPRRGSGSAPRRRASSCRRHSSSCPG